MKSIYRNLYDVLRNNVFNALGVERTLLQLIEDRDIGRVKSLLQNRDPEVERAIQEYDPSLHAVMYRRDKDREGKRPYVSEKLPRARQRYINEVELFFLLGNPIKWKLAKAEENDAFPAFASFLRSLRFDTIMRQAKRTAGAETEAAILFHLYRDSQGAPAVKPVVLSHSEGYTLRPLFDQYGTLIAFGYGYSLKEGGNTVEHFDIETPEVIYRARKMNVGWEVSEMPNPTGKINVVYIRQNKAWDGVQQRINREEKMDSVIADTNNYFGDPIALATADALSSLPDPDTKGNIIRINSKDGEFKYINPPTASDLQANEKRDLNTSILFDTFTPDMSFDAMKGMGTLSGEAMRRAMALGYMKRDNLREIYDVVVDRAKSIILAIMSRVTHIGLADRLSQLEIEHEFSEPFNEDVTVKWAAIGKAYNDGIISLDQAVRMIGVTDNPEVEIQRIKAEKTDRGMNDFTEPNF